MRETYRDDDIDLASLPRYQIIQTCLGRKADKVTSQELFTYGEPWIKEVGDCQLSLGGDNGTRRNLKDHLDAMLRCANQSFGEDECSRLRLWHPFHRNNHSSGELTAHHQGLHMAMAVTIHHTLSRWIDWVLIYSHLPINFSHLRTHSMSHRAFEELWWSKEELELFWPLLPCICRL